MTEPNLKERVREALEELKTGTSNSEGTGKAELQSGDVLSKLKLTDGHAKRNILSHRRALIAVNEVPRQESSRVHDTSSNDNPSLNQLLPKKTKAAVLDEQSSAIVAMSKSMQKSTHDRSRLIDAKIRKEQLSTLKDMKDYWVISEEEFHQKVRSIFDLIQ